MTLLEVALKLVELSSLHDHEWNEDAFAMFTECIEELENYKEDVI